MSTFIKFIVSVIILFGMAALGLTLIAPVEMGAKLYALGGIGFQSLVLYFMWAK